MSWALSAIAVYGVLAVFASGTLGDRTTMGSLKTSHRASTLDHVSGGRHRNSRREDVGDAHEVIRKDECMPYNDECAR